MPIISTIGRRSLKTRALFASMYVILGLGALSMIYPLLLMLSGSVKSGTDFVWVTPFPEYLVSDDVLWMKFHESKYRTVPNTEIGQHRSIGSFRQIRPPTGQPFPDPETLEDFLAFREQADLPTHWYRCGHVMRLNRRYQQEVERRFGTLDGFSRAAGVRYTSWTQLVPPFPQHEARHFTMPREVVYQVYYDLQRQWPSRDRALLNLDGVFWRTHLAPKWGTIAAYNAAHGTNYTSYSDVPLSRRAPRADAQRRDWELFVREDLNLAFIRIDPAITPGFQAYLRTRYRDEIAELNSFWQTSYRSFDEIPMPSGLPAIVRAQLDLSHFVRDGRACPLDALEVYGPRQGFEEFVAHRRGVDIEAIEPLTLPIVAADWRDFQTQKRELRWQFFTNNYRVVFDYLLMHGNGIRNTIIYCGLFVLVTLLINPLAAYALSRYRPPSTYKVLLFCMATMAFPTEVTMIPSFLLLKRFPLFGLIAGIAAGLVTAWLVTRVFAHLADWLKGVASGAVGIIVGFWLMPLVLGQDSTSVSLLNTFWALVLPAAANGFSVFLSVIT